jgi:hypothetical protein
VEFDDFVETAVDGKIGHFVFLALSERRGIDPDALRGYVELDGTLQDGLSVKAAHAFCVVLCEIEVHVARAFLAPQDGGGGVFWVLKEFGDGGGKVVMKFSNLA